MEIVLATPELAGPGGVQTYLLTIAPQLERLGHEVTLYARELGAMAELARDRGLRVAGAEHELPTQVDAVIAQDAPTTLALADRYPRAVRLIVVHSSEYDLHLPPGLDGLVAHAIVMSDVVERRVRALAHPPSVVRLRQPVEYARQRPVGVVRERPARVLLLGNYLTGRARATLVAACEDAGVAWEQVGVHGELRADPFAAIAAADVVVGIGRSLLDGMVCGRAGWVFGPSGGDGWITRETYAACEADGFRGRATGAALGADDFRAALDAYDPTMGEANRALVVEHHSPYDHAAALSTLLGQAPEGRRVDAPLRELARLVRTQHDAQARLSATSADLQRLHAAHDRQEQENRVMHEANGRLHDQVVRLTGELASAREQAAREGTARDLRLAQLEQELDALRACQEALTPAHGLRVPTGPLDRARRLLGRR